MLHLHPQITVMFLVCHLQPFSVATCHRMIAIHLGFSQPSFMMDLTYGSPSASPPATTHYCGFILIILNNTFQFFNHVEF